MTTIQRRLVLLLLLVLALAKLLVTREGGCDRAPPDDEPVPACKPGDKECYGATRETTGG